jgi:hypothetical protein
MQGPRVQQQQVWAAGVLQLVEHARELSEMKHLCMLTFFDRGMAAE